MDKLVGGSIMILVYVAVALLTTLRRPLLTMNSREEMVKYLLQVLYVVQSSHIDLNISGGLPTNIVSSRQSICVRYFCNFQLGIAKF